MNIEKMLKAQKELDEANLKKAGISEYPLDEVKTAYRVELGELLQEWKGFKYWKLSKGEVDKEKLLEEWADCCHFALSIEYYCCKFGGIGDILARIDFAANNDIYNIIDDCFEIDDWTLLHVIALGLKLGFTLKELEQAYYSKNKINWDRVNSSY